MTPKRPLTAIVNWGRLLVSRKLPLETETAWFLLVSVLDFVLTWMLLTRNTGMQFMESNPVARWVLDHWGVHGLLKFKLGMVLFILLITQAIAAKHVERARQVLYLGIISVGAVVTYSAWLLAKAMHQ